MGKKSRKTRQKELVASVIKSFDSFFTAEDLYTKVRKSNSFIGLATIYRFLKEMSREDKLCSYTCERKVIYSREKTSHCHFVCQRCGGVAYFRVDSLDFIRRKIKGDICHFQVEVSGICNKCQNKESLPQEK